MASFNFSQIKFERLALAVIATFLLADNVPHPKLGPSLVTFGVERVEQWSHHLISQSSQTQSTTTSATASSIQDDVAQ
jgi:hypothetical protein